MFGGKLIEKRVMAVVRDKINETQKKYDEKVEKLEECSVYDMIEIKLKLKTDKENLADTLVNEILSKIL